MNKPSSPAATPTQTPWVIAAHWTTVLLIVLGAAAILLRDGVDDKQVRLALLQLHRASGLMVLALTVVRAAISPWIKVSLGEGSRLSRLASSVSHFALYLLLVLLPAVGWALSSARGQSVYFLGVIPLPSLVDRDRDLADQLHEIHETLAIGLLVLVTLHSAAALWHHYVLKDGVLQRMLPRRSSKFRADLQA